MPKSSVIIECPGCHQKNRPVPGTNIRCGKCKRIFTALEIQRAAIGAQFTPPDPVTLDPDADDVDDEEVDEFDEDEFDEDE